MPLATRLSRKLLLAGSSRFIRSGPLRYQQVTGLISGRSIESLIICWAECGRNGPSPVGGHHHGSGIIYHWHHVGTGPRGVKVGTRVLYPVAELERWDQEQLGIEDERASSRRPV